LTFAGARALSKTKPREEIDLLQLPTNLAELITPFVLAWVCLTIMAILIPQGGITEISLTRTASGATNNGNTIGFTGNLMRADGTVRLFRPFTICAM
jgi:hypothetical protein